MSDFYQSVADEYIDRVIEHMKIWFLSDIWEHDARCDSDIQTAIDEVIKYMKIDK